MNAQQLKNAILQEAIEGRLVPQDPNDEPASALLARIRKEKEELVKAGKLKKKDLEVKPISEDEIPFEIPESWEWVRIKSIFTMQAGKNVTSADINSEQSEVFKYPCYGGNGLRGYVKGYNIEGIFPLVGRQGALCGNVNVASGKFWATEHAVVTDGYGMTPYKWQYYFLTALNLNQYATATAQPGLAVSNVIEVLIPLPPLAEQHRIVAKIEELLPKVEEYGKAQDALNKLNAELPERLKKSILQDAISGRLVPQDPNDEPASVLLAKIRKEKEELVKAGKLKKKDLIETPITEDEIPFEIPESWEWCRLSGVVYNHGQKIPNKRFSYIDIGSINNKCQCLNSSENIIEAKDAPSRARKIVKKGDIVYSTVRPYLHNVAIIDRDFSEEPIASTGFAVFSCLESVCNKFLFYYLFSPSFDLYANDGDNAKGVAYPAINDQRLYKAIIPLPPLAEQHRIVEKIEQVLGEIDKLKK
jgi:type I restriction enzyme S subunit